MGMQLIGVATKPQALKGQFRIKPIILNLKKFKKINFVTIDNKEYEVEGLSLRDTFVIVKLKGVDSCEQAETFRNKQIFADMEVEVETSYDLKGYKTCFDGIEFGTITDVNNFGSKDVISISGERSILVPNVDGLIVSFDEVERVVEIDKNIFDTVAVYED